MSNFSPKHFNQAADRAAMVEKSELPRLEGLRLKEARGERFEPHNHHEFLRTSAEHNLHRAERHLDAEVLYNLATKAGDTQFLNDVRNAMRVEYASGQTDKDRFMLKSIEARNPAAITIARERKRYGEKQGEALIELGYREKVAGAVREKDPSEAAAYSRKKEQFKETYYAAQRAQVHERILKKFGGESPQMHQWAEQQLQQEVQKTLGPSPKYAHGNRVNMAYAHAITEWVNNTTLAIPSKPETIGQDPETAGKFSLAIVDKNGYELKPAGNMPPGQYPAFNRVKFRYDNELTLNFDFDTQTGKVNITKAQSRP